MAFMDTKASLRSSFFLVMVSLLIVGAGSAVAQWADDFESYAIGTFPSSGGWQLLYNGAGNAYQYVGSAPAGIGGRALTLRGSYCWSSVAFRPFNASVDSVFTIAGSVLVQDRSTPGCDSGTGAIGLFNPSQGTWGTYYATVTFTADGQLAAGGQAIPYQTNVWYHTSIVVHMSSRRYEVYVNGTQLGVSTAMPATGMPAGVYTMAGHGAAPVLWFDDVIVTRGVVCEEPSSVTVTSAGQGTVTKNPDQATYACGATVALTATPSPGWHFTGWSGDASGSANPLNLLVNGNKNVTATFTPPCSVSVNTVGQGSVTRDPDQPTYVYGTTVLLTATASSGWSFTGWSGDASGTTSPLSLLVNGDNNITATFVEKIYTWNRTGSAAWGTATNWTPTRSSPAPDDVLIINGGGPITVSGVSNQTIGQLKISGNSTVALQPSAYAMLTIIGVSGVGLDIESGSTLLLNAAFPLLISLGAGATGDIGGAVTVSGAAHRMYAATASALNFQDGSILTLSTGFSGNFFGTGGSLGALNSVVFQSGSRLVQARGGDIFGASAPSAVVKFEPGSLFRLTGALTPTLAGRSYANFEQDVNFANTPTGTAFWSVDSLTVSQGTLNLSNMSQGGAIRGALTVKAGATLAFQPTGPLGLTLSGSEPQAIDVQGTFNTSSNSVLAVDNPRGATLRRDLTIGGTVSFVHGTITTAANTLVIGAGGTIDGAAQTSGWVAGNLRRNVAAGTSTMKFDVGDAAVYAPVTVAMNDAAAAFDVSASCKTPDHPNLATSDLDLSRSVNRYWSLSVSVAPSFTNFDATFSFVAADLDAETNPANLLVRNYNGAWFPVPVGVCVNDAVQGTGLTEFGDFALGELHDQWSSPVPSAMPHALKLYPCQPNPFNPMTTVKYDLPAAGPVRLSVFDVAGRLVRTLVDDSMPQGSHEAVWDGRDSSGREVGSGSYLARLEFGGKIEVVRMGLVR